MIMALGKELGPQTRFPLFLKWLRPLVLSRLDPSPVLGDTALCSLGAHLALGYPPDNAHPQSGTSALILPTPAP